MTRPAAVAGGLLDTPSARGWLDRVAECEASGTYTFGLAVDRLAGSTGRMRDAVTAFSSCSYLDLGDHPRIVEAAREACRSFGTSTGGGRLLAGTRELHLRCEQALAGFLRVDDLALFSSGYDANLSALSALLGRSDYALVDASAHRSILDGCRLAGCTIRRFAHNDTAQLRTILRRIGRGRRAIVVVDGVYSMDGDVAPLPELVEIKKQHGAFLMVDDSHAIGVLGQGGRGTADFHGLPADAIDVLTGSLGKAFPSGGGFVAATGPVVTYLRHGSAPYMFSSALTPANTAAIAETVAVLRDEPRHLLRMRENAGTLRRLTAELRLGPRDGVTPIVPVVLGEAARAYAWAQSLLERGIHVSAVTHPAVPRNSARIRLCATAGQKPEHFAALDAALREIMSAESGQPARPRADPAGSSRHRSSS